MVRGAFLPPQRAPHMVRTGAARVVSCSLAFRRRWIFKSFSNEGSWRFVRRQRSSSRQNLKMVVPAGNAPASSGYQPGALLLSYRTENRLERCTLATPLEVVF